MLSLFSFIQRYAKEDTSFGDAARYVMRRRDFPQGPNVSYSDVMQYMNKAGADPELRETIANIWRGPYRSHLHDMKRIREAADMQHEIFDRTDCYRDNGDLRREFMQRPELLLLATIAKGLFDIADAIRASK